MKNKSVRDDLDPARGVVWGLIYGLIFWVVVGGIWVIATG